MSDQITISKEMLMRAIHIIEWVQIFERQGSPIEVQAHQWTKDLYGGNVKPDFEDVRFEHRNPGMPEMGRRRVYVCPSCKRRVTEYEGSGEGGNGHDVEACKGREAA